MADFGSVVEIGCCVMRSRDDAKRLSGWAEMAGRPLVTRLPDVAVFAVADELDLTAARWRNRQTDQDASYVIEMAAWVNRSEDGLRAEPGANPGTGKGVVLSMARRLQSGEAELLATIRAYRNDHAGCRQAEVARALGISVRTLQRVWASSGERWTWAVS
jgi:hypothetical protein